MINESSHPLQAESRVETVGENISVRFRVTNTSSATVHVFASARMPYLLLEADGSLLVLHGVNSPDPNIDYAVIEVPTTQPLEPGQSVAGEVALHPLVLADHYEKQLEPNTAWSGEGPLPSCWGEHSTADRGPVADVAHAGAGLAAAGHSRRARGRLPLTSSVLSGNDSTTPGHFAGEGNFVLEEVGAVGQAARGLAEGRPGEEAAAALLDEDRAVGALELDEVGAVCSVWSG